MKVLYVGCRVRILFSYDYPELAGQTGTIISRHQPSSWTDLSCVERMHEWEVSVDSWGGSACPYDLGIFMPASYQLEPVVTDPMAKDLTKKEAV